MARRYDSTEWVSRTTGPSATAFTVMFWFLVETYAGAGFQGLFDLRTSTGLVAELTVEDSVNLQLWNNSSPVNLLASPAAGTWVHVYVRCSGAGNGLLQGGAATPGAAYTTGSLTVSVTNAANLLRFGGNAFDPSNHRSGGYKVWDAALSDAEIAAERYLLRPVRQANLHAWWPMHQAALAEQLNDMSGNGRNLTASGAHAAANGPPASFGAPVLCV